MVNNTPPLLLSSHVFVIPTNSQSLLTLDACYQEEIPMFIPMHKDMFLLSQPDDPDYPQYPLSYSDSDSDDYLSLYL